MRRPLNNLDYDAMARRALVIWSRDVGSWAESCSGRPVDLWSPAAVSFNRAGAVLRAIEEVVGRGKSTSRYLTAVDRRLSALLAVDTSGGRR